MWANQSAIDLGFFRFRSRPNWSVPVSVIPVLSCFCSRRGGGPGRGGGPNTRATAAAAAAAAAATVVGTAVAVFGPLPHHASWHGGGSHRGRLRGALHHTRLVAGAVATAMRRGGREGEGVMKAV